MAITSECEDGLKMIGEVTTNAQQIQEQALAQILTRNAGTEYLSRILRCKTDKQLFKKNVPIATYEDIKPYIDRIANGDPSAILAAQPVIEFHLRHFGDLDQTGKGMELLFPKTEIETASGLKPRTVVTSILKGTETFTSEIYTSPVETIFCSDNNQSMFCRLLVGLIHPYEVVTMGSSFATTVLRVIKFLEDNWKDLCSNIKTGQISDWITDSGCRNAVSLTLKANPELADSIENICSCKSWKGIIKKLWPKAKFIGATTTGAMSQYVGTLEFYSGGLPLVSSSYVCSEAFCGINLEPLSKTSDVSYTFLPNMAYFEFLPVKKDAATISEQVQLNGMSQYGSVEKKSSNEYIVPVDLVNVKPSQYYELVVTTFAGFHNNTPKFQFVERQNVILSIDSDKTSESELLKAVTEAKILLDPLGFFLRGYTSYADTSSTPGHYVIFWELKAKEGNDIKELDPKIMVECCSRVEESLNYVYKIYRKENAIAALGD